MSRARQALTHAHITERKARHAFSITKGRGEGGRRGDKSPLFPTLPPCSLVRLLPCVQFKLDHTSVVVPGMLRYLREPRIWLAVLFFIILWPRHSVGSCSPLPPPIFFYERNETARQLSRHLLLNTHSLVPLELGEASSSM